MVYWTCTSNLTLKRIEEKRSTFKEEVSHHTPESRLQIAHELDILRNGIKQETAKVTPETLKKPLRNKQGDLLQRNEGKWIFRIIDEPDTLTLVLQLSKYLDTSFIDVDIHPTYITVLVKGKVLQLNLEEEVFSDKVVCERSRLTGDLVVTMLKCKGNKDSAPKFIEDILFEKKKENSLQHRHKFDHLITKLKDPLPGARNKRLERLATFEPSAAVDIKSIVSNSTSSDITKPSPLKEISTSNENKIKDEKYLKTDIVSKCSSEFVDNPDVPPLCWLINLFQNKII